MKIIIADFQISKYGGIVHYVKDMVRAFHELGHDVDLAQITPQATTQSKYDKKYSELESKKFLNKLKKDSQYAGYEKDDVLGYYFNTYYGYFLPPNNRIGVYEDNALERWKNIVGDADIILWNFMPTKSKIWHKGGKKMDFWYKFFDLPNRIKQVFLAHDAYFNMRASNISALKGKILFIACAHIAAYNCCSDIGIPRALLFNPRYIENENMTIRTMQKRTDDFFAAHMFKSMKRMEELVSAIPYLQEVDDELCTIKIAGTGIGYSYMVAATETVSPKYLYLNICDLKRDPDLPKELDGKETMWKRALKYGMEYMGQMSGSSVGETLFNTKFAIDPSWSKHYAKYCRTHINGFIIEAMLRGAYPILRDYRGLEKTDKEVYDPLFENINAIYVPWNATPKQFGLKLRQALDMSPKKFLKDTKHNFQIVKELFNSKKNAEEIIRLCKGGDALIKKELEVGRDSDDVRRVTSEIMENFFGIELPIEWEED